MFTIGIRYLNGWSMAAADGAKKEQAEWPPHPDRIFMALAAAWFETEKDEEEGEALRWLEALDPPDILAPDATYRTVTVSYVPVNDIQVAKRVPDVYALDQLKKKGLGVLPEHRSRQPRRFPVAIPHVEEGCFPEVRLIWSEADSGFHQHRPALDSLAAKMTHVGHPASLVQAWVEDSEHIKPTWVPVEGISTHRLKTPYQGRLDDLACALNRDQCIEYADLKARAASSRGQEKKRLNKEITDRFNDAPPSSQRPSPGRWQSYGAPEEQRTSYEQGSLFNPRLVILRLTGKRISLPATLKLTAALRGLLLKNCLEPDQIPPEWLSGHQPTGKPSIEPHLAVFPLPFVGSEHADGRIMGAALALPREFAGNELTDSEIGQCLGPFLYDLEAGPPRCHKLFSGKWFECEMELENRERPPLALRPYRWTRASRVWASVTPVSLNRHFKGENFWWQAAEGIKEACEHIGLPRPREALLHPVSLVEGVPHARDFPRIERKDNGGKLSHRHLVLIFDEPVRGPILLGAGRFRGYGFCLPMDRGESLFERGNQKNIGDEDNKDSENHGSK